MVWKRVPNLSLRYGLLGCTGRSDHTSSPEASILNDGSPVAFVSLGT